MTAQYPLAELDPRFSSSDATATPWGEAERLLRTAELFWLSTVRPDGRPHVTPLLAVWLDGALYFCTGAGERKAHNLAQNAHCALTTGCNHLREGLDLVVEGQALRVRDGGTLQRVAELYEAKYGREWRFNVHDETLEGEEGNRALLFAVAPVKVLGFGKGGTYSQTRWRF
jgi:nitroimidazol reductase NimA-like FMN-containing flavoprotein (pyridoxamine 5'-phosphate oxidase superfamily)